MRSPGDFRFSRRDLLIVGAASLTAPALGVTTSTFVAKAEVALKPAVPGAPVMSKVSFTVNGKARELELDTRTTLLDALREHLHLTGTKKGCDHGQCGACTVIVDGRRINSCLTLAVMHEGDEHHHHRGARHAGEPASDAGRVRQARRLSVRLLHARADLLGGRGARRDQGRHPEPRQRRPRRRSRSSPTAEMRERMSGNICRCGAYSNIVEAITEVAGRQRMRALHLRARATRPPRPPPRRRARRAPSSSPAAPTCST